MSLIVMTIVGESILVHIPILEVAVLRKDAERARTETLLSLGGELSSSNCYLELQAGAGGTESHDWTEMLFKMYTSWAETRGFTGEVPLSSRHECDIFRRWDRRFARELYCRDKAT